AEPIPVQLVTGKGQTSDSALRPLMTPEPALNKVSVSLAAQARPDHVMLQFHRLMQQFLETQQAVMTSYLDNPTPALHSAPRGTTAQQPLPLAPAPLQTAAFTNPATSLGPSKTAERHSDDIRRLVLQVVSDRTGYPLEILDWDADLEADLGIDSIKRIEI